MSSHGSLDRLRTSLHVQIEHDRSVEVVQGKRHRWSFRAHYHSGDELVTISEGRARLRTASGYRDFEAGETGLVPAGTVHRFEALDREGWAFCSRFVSGPNVVWKGGRSAIIERVTQELSTRPTLQTDVVSVANACAVSPGHLSRIFRNQVGTSLHNFHVVLALHKAKKLLQQRESLVEAALDGGFFDQAHFTREFVRMIGLTPGSFRNAWAAAV